MEEVTSARFPLPHGDEALRGAPFSLHPQAQAADTKHGSHFIYCPHRDKGAVPSVFPGTRGRQHTLSLG